MGTPRFARGYRKKPDRNPRHYDGVNTPVSYQPLSNPLRQNSEPCASTPQPVVVLWIVLLRILRLREQKNGTSPKDTPKTAVETGSSLLTSCIKPAIFFFYWYGDHREDR